MELCIFWVFFMDLLFYRFIILVSFRYFLSKSLDFRFDRFSFSSFFNLNSLFDFFFFLKKSKGFFRYIFSVFLNRLILFLVRYLRLITYVRLKMYNWYAIFFKYFFFLSGIFENFVYFYFFFLLKRFFYFFLSGFFFFKYYFFFRFFFDLKKTFKDFFFSLGFLKPFFLVFYSFSKEGGKLIENKVKKKDENEVVKKVENEDENEDENENEVENEMAIYDFRYFAYVLLLIIYLLIRFFFYLLNLC